MKDRLRGLAALVSRLVLGLIFVAAGLGKLFNQAEPSKVLFNPFPEFMSSAFNTVIFTWLPLIELGIGICLIIGIAVKIMSVLSAGMLAAFIINNSWILSQGRGYEPCTCLGIFEHWVQAELSTSHALILDFVMLGMVLAILYWYPGGLLMIRRKKAGAGKQG